MHTIDKIIKEGYVIDSQKLMNSVFESYKKSVMLIMLIGLIDKMVAKIFGKPYIIRAYKD